jgi:uncharacterized protein (DUF302 family)
MLQHAVATVNTVTRLDIPTGQNFDEFVSAFEAAVPQFDLTRIQQLVEQHGTWEDVERVVAENGPNGFVIFGTIDGRMLMSLAGHKRRAIQYLMGNHIYAERMYRHHPDAVLYAPLRVLVHEADDGTAVFVLDQPSTVFAGLGTAEITAVARELDAKVADLLTLLDVPLPKELASK